MEWVNDVIQGILTGGLYALFACGLSLMFGVMKVVNLAHGDLAVVGGYVALGVIAITHVPVLWSFVIVVPIMAGLGYLLQRTLIQGALDRGVLTTLIVTFGLSVVIENALLQFVNANSHSLGVGNSIVTGSFSIGSQIQLAYLLLLIFAVAVAVLLAEHRYRHHLAFRVRRGGDRRSRLAVGNTGRRRGARHRAADRSPDQPV